MGASEMQAVMAAGFAGGGGLSGGACGALGAAIWIMSMDTPVEMEGLSYSGTWINDFIEAFLEISDYEFECSAIAGRQFDGVNEHAEYLNAGGCSEIIQALAVLGDDRKSHANTAIDEPLIN